MTINDIDINIICKNTIRGISIEWDDETDVEDTYEYVVVRNQLRYPRSYVDGIELYRGSEQKTVVDTEVKNGETYYYTLYFAVNAQNETYYLKTNNCIFRMTALLEGNYANIIYEHLPKIYRRYDNDISDDELLNKPLYRICRVFGYEFDKLLTYVQKIYDVIDIDTCPDSMLPSLMKFLGVDYDWNLSAKENRILTSIKISAYSKRGTISGLRIVLTNLLKSRIEIDVPKTSVRRDASAEDIANKRTITISAHNFQSDFVWVEENYTKFLEVIDEFVPRKFNVKLILINSFLDEYAKEKMSDHFRAYISDAATFVDVSRSVMDDGFRRSAVISNVIESPYAKQFGETFTNRLVEGRRRVDVYTASTTPEEHHNQI